MKTRYEICVQARLDPSWGAWLADVELAYDGATTLLYGNFDQAQLYAILNKLSRLGIALLSLRRVSIEAP